MTSASELPWVRPLPDRRGYRDDVILAIAVAIGMTVATMLYSILGYYSEPAAPWVSGLCIVFSTLPLVARRRYPEVVAIVTALAFAATQVLRVPELLFVNIALFIAIYSLGAWGRRRRRAIVVRALIVGGMFAWVFAELVRRAFDPSASEGIPAGTGTTALVALGLIQIITNLLYFGGAWYFGDRAWTAARERAILEARTAELAREREITSHQAIALERVRIARELHDVVAHHVSVMGLQAGAARRVLSTDRDAATAALVAIEGSARSAVDELHRMLTTLRDEHPTDSAHLAGIDHLEALLRDTRGAGVAAVFAIIGAPRAVPATVDTTVYRVAQEAVTNTLKHAGPGASIDMRLRYLDGSVEIEVSDDGSGRSSLTSRGSNTGGLGLIGMQERVTAVGGSLQVGPRPRGGYLVRAAIPAADSETTPREHSPRASAETASHAGAP